MIFISVYASLINVYLIQSWQCFVRTLFTVKYSTAVIQWGLSITYWGLFISRWGVLTPFAISFSPTELRFPTEASSYSTERCLLPQTFA
jgi:hypothetical protein